MSFTLTFLCMEVFKNFRLTKHIEESKLFIALFCFSIRSQHMFSKPVSSWPGGNCLHQIPK